MQVMDAVKALSSSVPDVKASKHNFIFYVLLLHILFHHSIIITK